MAEAMQKAVAVLNTLASSLPADKLSFGHVEEAPPSANGCSKLAYACNEATTLIGLAKIISKEAEKVDAYLKQHGGIYPSLDVNGPANFPCLPEGVLKSRQELVRATTELRDLAVGPTESLRWMGWDAINRFNIASSFPVGSTATFEDIAKAINVDEMNVRRLLRHAMANRIFKEISPGVVAHTAMSKVLAEDKMMQDWIGFCTEDMWPAAAQTVNAMTRYPRSQKMTQTGFQVANNTVDIEPMFTTLGKDPVRAKRFGGAMKSLTGGEGYEISYLVDNYNWAGVNAKAGTVVDIGGSHGFVCVELAKRYQQLKFIVQDLPQMVASAPKHLDPRIEFMAHDFHTVQPVKSADVYLFRWILHNNSDQYSLNILRQLIPALKHGSRILINDHCLPEPGTESLWDEKIIRTMDLVMLTLLNAQERSQAEFAALFAAAHPSYRFVGVVRPKGCRMSIIEAVWEGMDSGDV